MIKPPCVVAFLIALAASLAVADTITLKDGRSYDGTVIRENEEEIVISVALSESITDEIVIRREDIRGAVVKTPEDILEFEKLKAFDVKVNSMTPIAYEEAIEVCEKFQTQFPESAHRQQVANQIKLLKEEKGRVGRSEIKVNGRWYSPKEEQIERYQIKAHLLLQQMEGRAAAGDLIGALNAFDALETAYPGSAAYPKAVPLALSLIPKLKAEIARALPIAKQKEEKFNEGVKYQREPERSQMLAAHRQNQTRAEQLFKQSAGKWKPFFALLDESVSSLNSTIASEVTRLSAINVAPMDRSASLTESARELLASRKPDEALAQLSEASKVWNKNEAVPRLIEAAQSLKAVLLAEQAEREKAEEEAAKEREREAAVERAERAEKAKMKPEKE